MPRRIAALATLRDSFDHLYPIVEQLRLTGHDVPIYSTWKSADWATDFMSPTDLLFAPVDLWICASSSDAELVEPQPVVFVERGVGQTYDADERTYQSRSFCTGRIPNARLFLCPSPWVAQRRQNRHTDSALAICVGSPRMDQWHNLTGMHPGVEKGTVAFAFRWNNKKIPETRSTFPLLQPHLKALALALRRRGWMPVATAHPRIAKSVRWHTERSGFVWWPSDEVLTGAEVLVADSTSLMYEFAAVDRRIIALNHPEWRRDVDHGLRFWECVPGFQIDDLHPDTIVQVIDSRDGDDPDERARCSASVFALLDGRASTRAAEAIALLL